MKSPLKKPLLIIFIFIFLLSTVIAEEIKNSEYYFVIQENGNTIVGINLYGKGEITMPIQNDVEQIYLDGGLYMKDTESITIAIGSTESATLIYTTSLLTSKLNDKWIFSASLENQTNKSIIVFLPSNVIINEIDNKALIENTNITKIIWDNINSINFNYSFQNIINSPINNNPSQNNPQHYSPNNIILNKTELDKNSTNIDSVQNKSNLPQVLIDMTNKEKEPVKLIQENKYNYSIFYLAGILLLIIFATSVLYFKNKKKIIIKPRQFQVMQTLTDNENKIINLLLENRDILKRSFVEKKLKIAKSSLAATLNNLERKKMIEIDKSLNSHRIKLSDWFLKI